LGPPGRGGSSFGGGDSGAPLFGRLPMLGLRLGAMGPGMMQGPGVVPGMPILPMMLPLVAPGIRSLTGPVIRPPRPDQWHSRPSGVRFAGPPFEHSSQHSPGEDLVPSSPTPLNFSRPSPPKRLRIRRRFCIDFDDELEVKLCLLSAAPLPITTSSSDSGQQGRPVELEVELVGNLSSKDCYEGQTVQARLLKNTSIGDDKLPAGSLVEGRVCGFRRARRLGSTIVDRKSKFRNGVLSVQFSRIVTPDSSLAIIGLCPEQSTLFNNSGKFKIIRVNASGEIHDIEDLGIDAADPLPNFVMTIAKGGLQQSLGSVGSFGVLPLIMGAACVIEPRLVATKPIEEDQTSAGKRFVLGASGAMPAGNVVAAVLLKGDELELVEGDRLKLLVRPLTVTTVSAKIRSLGSNIAP
jgi:hypothetical protein